MGKIIFLQDKLHAEIDGKVKVEGDDPFYKALRKKRVSYREWKKKRKSISAKDYFENYEEGLTKTEQKLAIKINTALNKWASCKRNYRYLHNLIIDCFSRDKELAKKARGKLYRYPKAKLDPGRHLNKKYLKLKAKYPHTFENPKYVVNRKW